jgi:flagellar protein FlaI
MSDPDVKAGPLFNRLQSKIKSAVDKAVDKINSSSDEPDISPIPLSFDAQKAANLSVGLESRDHIQNIQNKAAEAKFSTDSGGLSDYERKSEISSDKPKFKPTESSFSFEKKPTAVELPSFENAQTIDVRYPLMPPFAYARIFWDKDANELVYSLEEPELSKVDRELLRLIQLGLEEMINVSFIRAKEANLVMQYLEKNVQSILVELGAKISKEVYQKVMYYIYRDSIGLNEIEPLMNDYFIEDVECNGNDYPLYIVHRKYQNLRTNVMFKGSDSLTNFVEKLAQKSGRYISFARPRLAGTLPDGSRVNATYTGDITTRGPTFTIRKFTKEPWTPVHLIDFKTASAETFAYLWLAIEHKFNIMTIGETASGKTTFMNSLLHFVPSEARVCSIEDTREINIAHSNWLPSVARVGFGMPNMMGLQQGEITLFDLLRETFRQNPDYVVVGEVRGNETYVLFQGMASGHPSFSTFHAASVPTLVRRLETPPISLPASLVESLDIVCVTSHLKGREQNIRRLMELQEIISVKSEVGKVDTNQAFVWDQKTDTVIFSKQSVIFKKITENKNVTPEALAKEFRQRTMFLNKLVENKIFDFKRVNDLFNIFIKNRDALPPELKA